MAFKMKGPSLYKSSPMKNDKSKTPEQSKKKENKRDTNVDRAVADMQYKKDSANETFNADAYRKTLIN